MNQTLLDYYRLCPDSLPVTTTTDNFAPEDIGFFRFGNSNICYGRCRSGVATNAASSRQFDASKDVHCYGTAIQLPFSFTEVVENLRRERYWQKTIAGERTFAENKAVHRLYYFMREYLPVSFRRQLQRVYFRDWEKLPFPAWPVDFTVDTLHEEFLRLVMRASGAKRVPFIWFWPEGAANCLIMTHDVETSAGRNFTSKLMDLDDSYGIKASFQVVPEQRYQVQEGYICEIRRRGFEFNIHDLNHDGGLYRDRQEFVRRAAKINDYVRRYSARGFRAGSMYRNQDWYDIFEFSYDMTVPNVAHLEPRGGGCCTVMPYFVGKIVELPLTTAQDYSLFHILNDYSIDLWKQQLDLIKRRNGLMSFISHPDYLIERRARNVYESLLDYLRQMLEREKIWAALPGDVNLWWRERSQMKLISRASKWEIVGPGKERAQLAYAALDGDRLVYELPEASSRKDVA